jgi:adenosylcobinamide kinase/adenosylcobinamide-phosphate guanylyltransferase
VTVACQSHLILGGARSGKSRHALAQARSEGRRTAVLATAQPRDADMAARIARHRAERPSAWATVEEPLDIVAACRRLAGRHDLILIDCLTIWVSNLIHRGDSDEAVLAAADDLAKLIGERAVALIIVSNEVGEGVHPPTALGLRFRDLLGSVNQRVAAAADRVTLMVAGIPMTIKDVPPAVDHERAPEAP